MWRLCLFSKATWLVSKLAGEDNLSFPSFLPDVLQTDINHVLSPKNADFMSRRTIKLRVTTFPHPSFCKTILRNYGLFVGFVDPCRMMSMQFLLLLLPQKSPCTMSLCFCICCGGSSLPVGVGSSLQQFVTMESSKWKRRVRNNKLL